MPKRTKKYTIEIESCGVVNESRLGRPPLYPFELLEIGQSFFVPHKKHGDLSGSARHAMKCLGITVSMRMDEKDGISGIRVIRTA